MFFPDLSKHFNLKIILFVMMEFVTLKKCVNKTQEHCVCQQRLVFACAKSTRRPR